VGASTECGFVVDVLPSEALVAVHLAVELVL
jgi:hypothetical protein